MSGAGRAAVALSCVLVLLMVSLSGCLSARSPLQEAEHMAAEGIDLAVDSVRDGLSRILGLRQEPLDLPVDITVNIVLVGLDAGLIDPAGIVEKLPKDYSPEILFGAPREGGARSGLVQNLRYEFHAAPDAFAEALFAQYPSSSREVPIPFDLPSHVKFLERYDAMYQLGRAGSGRVHLVDAQKIEAWIEANRATYGLDFEAPQYAIYFLDSYTKYGLWKNEYYWYEFAKESEFNADAMNMRAWGGTYDFLFLDYAAAPNMALYDNVGIVNVDVLGPGATPVPVYAPEGTAYNDPPAWHYRGGTATIGLGPLQKTVRLTDRVLHAVDVAVNLRLIGDYTLPPVYAERYQINVHLWHDGRSAMPQEGLDQLLGLDDLFRGLQAEVPWAKVSGSLKTYVAPRDDPGMAAALDRAKAEGSETYIPTPPITNYIDAHPDRYRQNVPGALEIMALLFLLEGHYAFVLPLVVGGVALASPDGLGWGTISSVNDYYYLTAYKQEMSLVADALIGINAHEIGHYFGLHHAHDGYRRTSGGYEGFSDHTWSTTNTVMSYRLRPETTDTFHRDLLARGHTIQNLEQTLRNVHSVYRNLEVRGFEQTPPAIQEALRRATQAYDAAVEQFEAGQFQAAVLHAIQARRSTEAALAETSVAEREDLVLTWSTSGVNGLGAKASALILRPAVAPTGVKFDLRTIQLTDDVESLHVRVEWSNGPDSWGDFFAAWKREGVRGPISFGSIPVDEYVEIGAGVHDSRDEGPGDGKVVEEFRLDLDAYPGFRDGKPLLVGGGTRGLAVNGAYSIEVRVAYRDHGDGRTFLASMPEKDESDEGAAQAEPLAPMAPVGL